MVTPHEPRQVAGEPLKEGNMRQEQEAVTGEPKTHTLEKRRESAAATILRHLQAGPATVVELMDRIHADTTRPEVGTPGWRIVTTHLVADTLSAVEALGDLLGQKFLSRDERGAIALTLPLGVPVVARDEAAELRAAVRDFLELYDQEQNALRFWQGSRTRDAELALIDARADLGHELDILRRLAGGEEQE